LRNSFGVMGCVIVLGGFMAGADPSCAAQVYSYTIEHPTYGEIGTYTDTIEKSGDTMRIDTRLRVAVKVLGIVLHREEADRTEVWKADRLVSFHSVTTTNGKPIEVRGEAHDNGFVITSPTGTVVAPSNVYTSSPWSTRRPNTGLMMSTKTGRVETVQTVGGEETLVPVYGSEVPTRHYQFITDKHQDVWLDGTGIPVRFRTEVAGKPIDFVLAHGAVAALGPQ
jgi:hypothetical protein